MSGLYDEDVLLWSEQQADLLRRAARGERVNGLDWDNIVEEIQDVGLSELASAKSLVRQALAHLLKLHGWPACEAAPHWRGEIIAFLDAARDRFAPSMSQRIDISSLYRSALRQVGPDRIDGQPPRPLPPVCPFTLAELLAVDADPIDLVAKLDGG
jgi:hypothetical protein